jgi:hypothetical protein
VPTTPPVADEVKAYVAEVDAIMRGREIALQALAEVVTLQGARTMTVDEAMPLTVRRREVTKDALEELEKLQPPGQAARIHELYVTLLNDDVVFTDKTVAALRAGDIDAAAQFIRSREERTQETLATIRETAKVLGVGRE